MQAIAGKRVLIMGLGRFGGGVGAATFCAQQGAKQVLVTDLLGEADLTESMAKLEGLPITYRLGEHREADFADADLVIVNPAVDRRLNRYLHAAAKAGTPMVTEIELLLERLPNRDRTIGITGSAGKSTVTSMIAHALAQHHGRDHVHVGGNLGGSLLPNLANIAHDDWVVLELSSFMLAPPTNAPEHAENVSVWGGIGGGVVTNIGDNHLDRHGSLDAYVHAKKTILRHQQHGDWAVLGPTVADWQYETPARCVILDKPLHAALQVVGEHNALNAAMAVAACEQTGMARQQAIDALANFNGLPHRLQHVAEHSGRTFYNDSKSTTPDAAMLGLDSFARHSVHLILGGYDKHADLRPLARHAGHHAAAVYTIGQTGHAIAEAAEAVEDGCLVHRCETLEAAVRHAVASAQAGQVVLLSPGCASWDQFTSYEQRGRSFGELVLRYTTETGSTGG
ncbi:MAG: UDP-N-acetylmuramoyl-L-alanine--D-glutamate ligase [Phycisphaeraceae bacterium]